MSFALGEMGLSDRDFWDLTPYELHRRLVGWRRKQRASQLLGLTVAWHTAALQRSKRMPRLSRLLKQPKPRKVSREELAQRRRDFEEHAKRAGVPIHGEAGSNVI